jgi:hypothetical protein
MWVKIQPFNIVDSLSFFTGMIDSNQYSFKNLSSGKYYISVFDNSGTKILSDSGIINTTVEFYDNSDLILDKDGRIKLNPSAQSIGKGRLRSELMYTDEYGGVDFTIETFGNLKVGFNKSNDSVAINESDYEVGISLSASGAYQIIESGILIGGTDTLSSGSDIKIFKDYNDYVITINSVEVYRGAIPSLVENNSSFDMSFSDVAGKIKLISYIGKFKKSGVSTKITYPECGDQFGDITLYNGLSVVIADYPQLKNNHTAEIIYATNIGSGDYSFLDVPIGSYTMYVSYYVPPPPIVGGFGYGYSIKKQVAIGYRVEWADLIGNAEISYGSEDIAIKPNLGYLDIATAHSTNRSRQEILNWVQFESRVSSISEMGFQVLYIEKEAEYAMAVSNNSLTGISRVYDKLSGEYTEIEYGNNGIWRIDEFDNNFSIYNKNIFISENVLDEDEGDYFIRIYQFLDAIYLNVIASYCNNYPIPDQFVTPKREIEGGYYLVPLDDSLRFEFNEEYAKGTELNYKVRDYRGEIQSGLDPLIEEFGDNRFMLDISTLAVGYYILEIINDKGENWFLRFKTQG